MDFRESKRVERPISDMRVHIDYQAQRMSVPWSPPTKRNDRFIFKARFAFATEAERQESVRGLPSATEAERQTGVATGSRLQLSTRFKLDAFKVRDEFHELDTKDVDAVLAFLNATGAFWPVNEYAAVRDTRCLLAISALHTVTAAQIAEWQEFSKAIHCNNLATMRNKVRRAISGYPEEFFSASYDFEDLDVEYNELVSEGPPDRPEDAAEHWAPWASYTRRRVVGELVRWFICPPNGMLKIDPLFRKTARQGGNVAPPHAEIKAISVLEAVAACAWVERFGGVQYRKCKLPDCPKIFKVESEHDQRYCSDSCAATFRQRKKRARDKKKAAAQERARQKNKAAVKPNKGIQHPKTQTKRGAK